jgi:hypothetical protein
VQIIKGLEGNSCACKSFRIRRYGDLTEVRITKHLARGSFGSKDEGGADPSRLPSVHSVNRAGGLRRQGRGSFLLRDELRHEYSRFLLTVKCYL